MRAGGRTWAAVAATCVAAVFALPPTAGAAGALPSIGVPKLPNVATRNIVVDTAEIARRAAEAGPPAPGTDPGEAAASFFYGDLAMASFDDVCDASDAEMRTLLGNILVSGYFGGVWFRDQVPGLQPRRHPLTPVLTAFSRGTVGGVDAIAGRFLRAPRLGPRSAVGEHELAAGAALPARL